jgi:tetratricopeptide (TPR) repeat protein
VTLSPLRRTVLAALGVGIAAALLRPQLADALVVRGDEFLYRGDPARSLEFYRRALVADPDDGAAVDRFAFAATSLRDRAALAEAIGRACDYLRRHPEDTAVRMDRAMAYRRFGDARRALADFALVGARTADPRALTFAGFEARGLGESNLARRFWRSAVAVRPRFPAAVRALERRT